MRGKGITGIHALRNGDEHVRVYVEVPPHLGGKERDLLKAFADANSDANHPRRRKLYALAEEFYAHKKAMEGERK